MAKYRKIDENTVEKTEVVVETIKISNISQEIKMLEQQIQFYNNRLAELKNKQTIILAAKDEKI